MLITSIVMLMSPVVKSAESGKLINPQTTKEYSYDPKKTGYIILGLSLASIVGVFILYR